MTSQEGVPELASAHRRILVTGGSGFVGQAVLPELLAHGHTIFATACSRIPDMRHRSLTWILWNATETSVPEVPWSEVDIVLHLASPRKHAQDAAQLYRVAVGSTVALLEQSVRHGISRFLVASTGDVLGPLDRPARETDDLYRPDSFYGTVKACAEMLARAFSAELQIAVLRFYHPYGPVGDPFLINRLMAMVAAGSPVTIEGEDGIWLNPVWIEDLAAGVRLAVESDRTGTFHFAGPEIVPLRKVLEVMGEIAGHPASIQVRPGEPSFAHAASFEDTQRALGYRPRVSLRSGLERLAAAYAGGVTHA
jgi:UDP-glucose 4-epimerase